MASGRLAAMRLPNADHDLLAVARDLAVDYTLRSLTPGIELRAGG